VLVLRVADWNDAAEQDAHARQHLHSVGNKRDVRGGAEWGDMMMMMSVDAASVNRLAG
jgi:hypothetical protein